MWKAWPRAVLCEALTPVSPLDTQNMMFIAEIASHVSYVTMSQCLVGCIPRFSGCLLRPNSECKTARDNLDSIGGFKSRDTLQFCIPILDEAST